VAVLKKNNNLKVFMSDNDLPVIVPERPKLVRRKLDANGKPIRMGRPKKEDLKKAKLPMGRPKNDTGRLAELKQRLLGTSGTAVVEKIIKIALDDGNAGQMAALKMCVDRILPMSMFEKDAKGQRNAIQINITGIGEAKIETSSDLQEDVIDMDTDS
jgi:hypothetical protein